MVHHDSTNELQLQPAAPARSPSTTICLVLPNWIGDVVMATPTIRAIAEHFGDDANIIGVMRPYVAQVLDGTPWIRSRVFHDPYARDARLHSLPVVRQLRRSGIDTVVLLSNSFRTGAIAWLSGAHRRVGYRRYGRGLLLTHGVKPCRQGRTFTPISAVDYYLDLAERLNCPVRSKQLELACTPTGESHANRLWQKWGWKESTRVVTLCPAGIYGKTKHWPTEHFASLARLVATQLDSRVLVTCGPAEVEGARRIAELADHSGVVSLADEPISIELTKSCIQRSQLVVSTDSGPRHIAAAFSKPTLALFGSTDPRWSANYNPQEVQLSRSVECSPCGKRVCPFGDYRCMKELTPGMAFDAILGMWNQQATDAAA